MKHIKPTYLKIKFEDGSERIEGPYTTDTTRYLVRYMWEHKPEVLKVTLTKEPKNA